MRPDEAGGKRRPEAGLCGRCKHAREVVSDRGSVFIRCELAASDKRFEKYPRLPVVKCEGFEEREH